MSLKDFYSRKLIAILAFAAGLSAAGYPLHYRSERLKKELGETYRTNHHLKDENDRLRYINSLAVEFSMDPLVVTLCDQYAHQHVVNGGSEWRLVRTPEFLTYIMLSLIYAESKGDAGAVGDGGKARGLTQIWVSTAQGYGKVSADQLLDPETNIAYSFKHFHELLKKYRGNLAMALYAWNRGPGTVDRLLLYGQSPENGYGKRVYEASLDNNRSFALGE